jgi:hypothetical protein
LTSRRRGVSSSVSKAYWPGRRLRGLAGTAQAMRTIEDLQLDTNRNGSLESVISAH